MTGVALKFFVMAFGSSDDHPNCNPAKINLYKNSDVERNFWKGSSFSHGKHKKGARNIRIRKFD